MVTYPCGWWPHSIVLPLRAGLSPPPPPNPPRISLEVNSVQILQESFGWDYQPRWYIGFFHAQNNNRTSAAYVTKLALNSDVVLKSKNEFVLAECVFLVFVFVSDRCTLSEADVTEASLGKSMVFFCWYRPDLTCVVDRALNINSSISHFLTFLFVNTLTSLATIENFSNTLIQ